MSPNGVTILRSPHRRLAKTVASGVVAESYDRARLFDLAPRAVVGLDGMELLLHELLHRTDCAIARGAPADAGGMRRARRLLHADPKVGQPATILDVPRAWVALDLDGLPLPQAVSPLDLPACAAAVLPLLPQAFHGAACIVQATASHGIKPGARLRLWYWLSRPLTGIECRRWLRCAPVDRSVLGASQIIYTAAPLILNGADPIARRLARLQGAAEVLPPEPAELAEPSTPVASYPAVPRSSVLTGNYAIMAMARAAARIMQASEGDRHATAVSQAFALSRLLPAGVVEASELEGLISAAIVQAGKSPEEGRSIAAWAISRRLVAGGSA